MVSATTDPASDSSSNKCCRFQSSPRQNRAVVRCLTFNSCWDKNVTFRAAGVGPVALLLDQNDIAHVAVRKAIPEGGLTGKPPLVS